MYPAAFRNGPEIYSWLQWHMDTWDELGRYRQAGMGAGPIPASEILAYCDLTGITWQEVKDELLYVCGILDDVYVPWANKSKDEEKEAFVKEQREKLRERGYGDC